MTLEQEPDPLRRIPTKHTTALRAEIGPILRAARLKRGQSLEAVAQQTRISKRFLEALEEDRFDEFPAFVYMRGFLKSYCEHLDVPFAELWAIIQPSAVPETPRAQLNSASAVPAPKPEAKTPVPSSAPAATPAMVRSPSEQGHALTPRPHVQPHEPAHGASAVGAIALAVVMALGLGIFIIKDRKAAATAKPVEITPRVLMPLTRTVDPKVGLRAIDDAWVRVRVDGAVVFEGRIPRGAAMEWKPSHGVTVRTTAPSSLQLSVNGAIKPLTLVGADGEYRIDFP